MPRYAQPKPSMPEGVKSAAEALALTPIRLSILRELTLGGEGLTAGVLQEATGATRETLLRHLRELERSGLIEVLGGADRAGRHLVYRANPAVVSAAFDRARRYALGETEAGRP